MRFHYRIMAVALLIAGLAAGVAALQQGEGAGLGDLADPGYWMALGGELLGAKSGGWCACS